MNDVPQPQVDVPQLRTLLLTDLCDSTELVEKLGDAAAAELFREHDTLVLQLQQQWRGRLIDRSDGLLLLFERPIDGLGFALDYQHGLRDLGQARKLRLKARAGLHVGEVLTWRNSEEAVQIGAKPLEVEGLAKPVAARLMSLARPGQILLSAVAESLTQRATRELGERGERLLWKSHGRWRFKGMPTRMEIYEVGEVGLTPLRAPKNSPKAWRDVPLWRRPAALVAEAAVLATIAVGGWFFTRPEPALAFAERDWVVVGDMRNLTGDTLLDDSLQQAFRISLEQSRYVNLLSDLKVRQTLTLMRRDPDASRLDRQLAAEVAIRDGARAVILPTVVEVGGQLRVTAEVVDPRTQATIYAVTESGRGTAELLASIDQLSIHLRSRLGEAMEETTASGAALPKVTTSNLDALRAYALATKFYGRRQFEDAKQYFHQATKLDPSFALAYLGLVRAYVSTADNRAAMPYLEKAASLRASLPPRDALYLDAWLAELGSHPWRDARPKWDMLAEMYPDYFAGAAQSAWLDFSSGDFGTALRKTAQFDAQQNPLRDIAFELRGRILLAREDYQGAQQAFQQAEQIGGYGPGRRRAAALAAAGDFAGANGILDKLTLQDALTNGFEQMTVPFAAGKHEQAEKAAESVYIAVADASPILRYGLRISALSILSAGDDLGNHRVQLQALVPEIIDAATAGDAGDREDLVMMAMTLTRLAQRNGIAMPDPTVHRLEALAGQSGNPPLLRMLDVLHAEQSRLRGRPDEAVALLRKGNLEGGTDLLQAHVALRDALKDAGDVDGARRENKWLAEHPGLAYIEPYGALVMQGMNVADVSEARRAGTASGTAHASPPIAAATH